MHNLKKTTQQLLESNDLAAIVELAEEHRRELNLLVRFAYAKETLSGWRAIKAIGLAAKALITREYEFLREVTRKLFWSLSDESGGIGWSAPELIGEIVSVDPARFSDLIPMLASVYDIEETTFRPGVLYALGRIAETSPERVMPHQELLRRGLSDLDPLSRVHALEAVRKMGSEWKREDREGLRVSIERLLADRNEVWIYREGGFEGVQVKEAAQEVLEWLNAKQEL